MKKPLVKNLGLQPYSIIYNAMHQFTQQRDADTQDEIWLVEHPAIFTQGKVGKAEHLLHQTNIPVIQTDRGGQITYHAPGQQIMYILIDLKRLKMGIRDTVSALENSVINTLNDYHISAVAKPDAPGVYVNEQKICSLGLHIQHGCTLHGLALNVDMDLSPFNNINPCGYAGLKMTQVKAFLSDINPEEIRSKLVNYFIDQLYHVA
ncbi:lipoyl(octanoyl) transferase [Frischella perrara]|uniref:Octanoyltransferase n=1 Tax=Frischella perrara TaxID=1267021 RepID=A0A0A7S1N4_FRIPE|nr:lipoyl(octanoyl) transferase LipB [Frischella perrara]AJA45394.1 lipoate-protein ligase B [Frischella perrara]PWV63044.1 lipoyl(octanoyl) transferase [Frischella perrara]